MDRLSSHRATKEVVQKHNFKFSKSLGQNFLIDDNVIDRILAGARLSEGDRVIEVGPGIGTLTREMGKVADKVVAVEIDKTLIPILKETLEDLNNVEVVNQDILKVDVEELVKEKLDGGPVKLVANLPYYITTPIVMKFLEEDIPVTDIVVMVQKEVADRILASPSTKEYGSLTIFSNYYSKCTLIKNIPACNFIPAPKVDSVFLKFKIIKEREFKGEIEKEFLTFVKKCFSMRRKTLFNVLSQFKLNKSELLEISKNININFNQRAETLHLEDFKKMFLSINKSN